MIPRIGPFLTRRGCLRRVPPRVRISLRRRRRKRGRRSARSQKTGDLLGLEQRLTTVWCWKCPAVSSDNDSLFRDGPSSGNGTSLQLQLQEYARKCPGRLAARLLQRMQAMVGKEGGRIQSKGPGNRTPPVAMNWVLVVLGPKQLQVRTLREMKTLRRLLSRSSHGSGHPSPEVKGLELSTTDASCPRGRTSWKGTRLFSRQRSGPANCG